MKTVLLTASIFFSATAFSQEAPKSEAAAAADTTVNTVTVIKDPRLDILGKKEAEFSSRLAKTGKGYRLMVISSNDKDFVMKVRAQLLQKFPDQKVYMSFQAPYIKIKFGNFEDKAEAERYKKMISSARIVTTSVYLVPETIEVKPDKNKDDK